MIAGQAVSVERVPRVAVITDRSTLSILVEKGSAGALGTGTLALSFAKRVRNSTEVGVSDTLPLRKIKSLIAGEASSRSGVPGSALITDGHADILLIEEESD